MKRCLTQLLVQPPPRKHWIFFKLLLAASPNINKSIRIPANEGIWKNLTLLNMVRSMLKSIKMPSEFWAKVVACATYLSNRCQTESVHGKNTTWSLEWLQVQCIILAGFWKHNHAHVLDEKRNSLMKKVTGMCSLAMIKVLKITICWIQAMAE